jgi:hypothetical protein
MNNCRFEAITVLGVFILLTIIKSSYSTTVPNKDDSFTINITMKNFQTTQVYTKIKLFLYENFYAVFFCI